MAYHPILGFDRRGDEEQCSRCCGAIPDDAVPLMLFSQRSPVLLWKYCEECEADILDRLLHTKPGASPAVATRSPEARP